MSTSNGITITSPAHHSHRATIRYPDLLTTGDVARLLGCAPRTVTQWIDSGRLRGFRLPSGPRDTQAGDRRIHRRHLAAFVREYKIDVEVGCLDDPVVLAIGCEVLEPGATEVLTAASSFEAGCVVSTRRPVLILADAALGRLELGQIAAGCRLLADYQPVLAVAGPPDREPPPAGWARRIVRPVRGADLAALWRY